MGKFRGFSIKLVFYNLELIPFCNFPLKLPIFYKFLIDFYIKTVFF